MAFLNSFPSGLLSLTGRLSACVAAFSVVFAEAAHAQDLGAIASTVDGQVSNLNTLLVDVCQVGGIGYCGSGLAKLKSASDTQGQQTRYSEGAWRLLVGAGLAGIPTVAANGSASLFGVH